MVYIKSMTACIQNFHAPFSSPFIWTFSHFHLCFGSAEIFISIPSSLSGLGTDLKKHIAAQFQVFIFAVLKLACYAFHYYLVFWEYSVFRCDILPSVFPAQMWLTPNWWSCSVVMHTHFHFEACISPSSVVYI